MVRLERRKGLLFSTIILGAVVSGTMYYYIRDYWGLEAKVRVSSRGCQYSVVFLPPINEYLNFQRSLDTLLF